MTVSQKGLVTIEDSIDDENRLAPNLFHIFCAVPNLEDSIDDENRLAQNGLPLVVFSRDVEDSIDDENRLAQKWNDKEMAKIKALKIPLMMKIV